MDASVIYKALFRYYANYQYKLSNAYVYNWESDFFGMSKAGYFLEVEVKVSRNDYFRDFIKEKHRLFADVSAGKKFTIDRWETRGDLICTFHSGRLISQYGEYARHISSRHKWAYALKNGKVGVWANDYGQISIRQDRYDLFAPATGIRFKEVETIKCPNQIYFACPAGLINVSEVPEYAGLLYFGHNITLIKKAPYLHKRKQDLTSTLLSKFYNLWNNRLTTDQQTQVSQALNTA